MTDRILRLPQEISRLRVLRAGTAHQFRFLYLHRTMRSVSTELQMLRAAAQGPGFVVERAVNRKRAYVYDVEQVLAFFGGEPALFDRRDRPEIFSEKAHRVVVKPRRAA